MFVCLIIFNVYSCVSPFSAVTVIVNTFSISGKFTSVSNTAISFCGFASPEISILAPSLSAVILTSAESVPPITSAI